MSFQDEIGILILFYLSNFNHWFTYIHALPASFSFSHGLGHPFSEWMKKLNTRQQYALGAQKACEERLRVVSREEKVSRRTYSSLPVLKEG